MIKGKVTLRSHDFALQLGIFFIDSHLQTKNKSEKVGWQYLHISPSPSLPINDQVIKTKIP